VLRRTTMAVVLLLVCSIVSACVPAQSAPQGASKPASKIVVRQWEYSADPNAIEISKQMIQKFNDQSSTIEVRMEIVPRDTIRQKLMASIEAGEPPELVRFDLPWTPEFASLGHLEKLTSRIKAWGEIDDFYKYRLETVTFNGDYYGIPSNSNNLALFYNQAMIDAAKITAAPKNWAELKGYAKQLTVMNSGAIDVAGLIFGAKKNETIPFQFFPWLWQAGGEIGSINSAAGVAALTEWMSYLDGNITPQGALSWGHTEERQQFEAGKAAMMINGTGYAAQLKKNAPDLKFGVWPLPCEKQCASVLGGEDWVMMAKSKQKDAAWEVLKFYSSKDVHEWWCLNTNTIPSRISVGKNKSFTDDPSLKVFTGMLDVSRPRPVIARYAEISDAVQIAVQAAITHQKTPKVALDDAQAIISGILK
jgi:multiple sugar transport system substrate-binding protein